MRWLPSIGMIILLLLTSVSMDYTESTESLKDLAVPLDSRAGPHGIIRINNSNEFLLQAQAESWPGNGLPNNPYIIEELIIDAKGNGNCIYIGNTSVHFIIRNCTLYNASGDVSPWAYGAGITLNSVQFGRIESNNISDNKIGVFLYSSNYNTIYNNTCSFNNQSGIFLDATSDYNKIQNNTCEWNNYSGIFITYSFYNLVENNTCNSNHQSGINLYTTAKYNVINNNTCESNDVDGIELDAFCGDNEITNNNCNLNWQNGIHLEYYCDEVEINNNICQVNNWSGIFVYGMSRYNTLKYNNCTDNNLYGIAVSNCDGIDIENNSCNHNNYYGIYVQSSRWDNITKNICNQNNISGIYFSHVISSNVTDNKCIFNNDTGLNLSVSDYNIFDNNICNLNNGTGIFLSHSDYNIINNSNFSGNVRGVELLGISATILNNRFHDNIISYNTEYGLFFTGICANNRIFHNNIISNTIQAGGSAAAAIIWDDGNGEGNYWSDYTGLDNGAGDRPAGDGIGDTLIPHLTYDNYPFTTISGWRDLPSPILHDSGWFNNTGDYTISWNVTHRAIDYILEEDDDQYFITPDQVYNGPELSVHLTGRDNGTYYYRLKAFNDYTTSDWSLTIKIGVDWFPAAPTGLIAKNPTGHNIILNWTPHPEQDIQQYYIYINETGAGSSGPFWYFYSIDAYYTEYIVMDLFEETTYYFVIAALDNMFSLSQYSNVASATTKDETAPAAPTGLNATVVSDSEVKLTWDPNSEADIAGYNIYMNESNTGSIGPFEKRYTVGPQVNTYTITGLNEQVTYYFKLKAFDEVPYNSSYSIVVSATPPDLTPPSAPTDVTVSDTLTNSLTISWAAPPEEDVVGYFVYRSSSSDGSYSLRNLEPVNVTTFVDTNLNESTVYYYKVQAIDDADLLSPLSNFAFGRTSSRPMPPEINNSISDVSFTEDSVLEPAFNLYHWFRDPNNDPLHFSYLGNAHVKVTIKSDYNVRLAADKDWSGQETLTFYAFDGLYNFSDEVKITVTPVNDPPETPEIIEPQDGVKIKLGESINFYGRCEDADLPYGDELTFNWFSDIEGFIGIGMNLSGVKLPLGDHVITLKVSDIANSNSSTEISLIVQKDKEKTNGKDEDMPMSIGLFSYDIPVIAILIIIIILIIVLIMFFRKKKPLELEMPPDEEEKILDEDIEIEPPETSEPVHEAPGTETPIAAVESMESVTSPGTTPAPAPQTPSVPTVPPTPPTAPTQQVSPVTQVTAEPPMPSETDQDYLPEVPQGINQIQESPAITPLFEPAPEIMTDEVPKDSVKKVMEESIILGEESGETPEKAKGLKEPDEQPKEETE